MALGLKVVLIQHSVSTRALESEIKFEGNVSQINIYCPQEARFLPMVPQRPFS